MTSNHTSQSNIYDLDETQQPHFRSFDSHTRNSHNPNISLATEPSQTGSTSAEKPRQGLGRHSRSQTLITLGGSGPNIKRLANLIGTRDTSQKAQQISETSFHSPTHSNNKSMRQKIANVKPVAHSHSVLKDSFVAGRANEITGPVMNRMYRNSTTKSGTPSDLLPSSSNLINGLGSNLRLNNTQTNLQTEGALSQEGRDMKLKQVANIYRNQSIADKMRKSRAQLNSSKPHSNNASHSPGNSHSTINRVSSAQDSKSQNIVTSPTNGSTLNVTEFLNDMSKQPRTITHKHSSSHMQLDKDMLLGGHRALRNGFTTKKSLLTSINGSAMDFNRHNNSCMDPTNTNSTTQGYLNLGANSSNMNQSLGWESMQQSQVGRGEVIENKVEALLTQKSTELSHMDNISATLDLAADMIGELNPNKEGQRHRNLFRKIKLAYELFFQNYTHQEQIQKSKAEESTKNLRRDYEVLEARSQATNTELESMRKENERLQQTQQSNKNQRLDSEETPPVTKHPNQKFSQMHNAEALKLVIRDQQSTIQTLKKKEAKMIRLLYACKKKGLDIEQIYHEDVKSSMEREEEAIPTLNKGDKHHQSHSHLHDGYQASYQAYVSHNKESDSGTEQPTSSELRADESWNDASRLASDLYSQTDAEEKSSDFEQVEIHKQPSPEQGKGQLNNALRNKLKLDFSQLARPKSMAPQKQMEFEIHDMSSVLSNNKAHHKHKKHISALQLDSVIEEQKPSGFHDEFMSRIDEFSVSWRKAAENERKLP